MRQSFLLLDFEDASADSLKCMLMSCTLQPLYLTSEEVCVGRIQYNMSGVHLCSRICGVVHVWKGRQAYLWVQTLSNCSQAQSAQVSFTCNIEKWGGPGIIPHVNRT